MEDQSKIRVDRWVKNRFPDLSQAQVLEAIDSGLVLGEGGRRLKKGEKGEGWDTSALEAHLKRVHLGNSGLVVPVVDTREGYVVVDKPTGMTSHPVHLTDDSTLSHWALAKYPETRQAFPEAQPTLVPHRLDTGTSGLQIVATTRAGFDLWRQRFVQKKVEKTYLAWCWGKPPGNTFDVNYGLAHLAKDPRKMGVPALGDETRGETAPAQSQCKVLARRADRFLVQVMTHGGVTHQVRVHLASLGFPLLGDALYDPQHKERGGEFPHHLLRAIKLFSSNEESFALPTESYLAFFT